MKLRRLRIRSLPILALVLLGSAASAAARAAGAKAAGFESRSADAGGIRLAYLTGGSGPPLLLLHGYAETSRMWIPILPQVTAKFRVIAPDLPGIGDSAIPANGLDMKNAATSVHALVRSRHHESPRRRARHRPHGGVCVRRDVSGGD